MENPKSILIDEEPMYFYSSDKFNFGVYSKKVKSPKNILSTSKELGDFKLEYSGNTYFYRDTNYMLYQIGNELKGSCPLKVREQINLKKGEVVHFTNKGVKDDEGNLLYIDQVNITKEKIDIYED